MRIDGGQASSAKNVVLMVIDGASFNAIRACTFYQYGALGEQVYESFPIRLACTTYMLDKDGTEQGYDPRAAWLDFDYVRSAATGSAAASTAHNTGFKTVRGRVNTDIDGAWLVTIAELAFGQGRASGAVSSVMFSHATPACVWAHNVSRGNYEEIANEMICSSGLKVIIGAGHPGHDDNGKPAQRAWGLPNQWYVDNTDVFTVMKEVLAP